MISASRAGWCAATLRLLRLCAATVDTICMRSTKRSCSLRGGGPLRLERGVYFGPLGIAYQTYARLNPERSNALLICHALSGAQYVAEPHPITGAAGWWTTLVGPGGVLDTERYFLICANVLGGCMGTTGPKDVNPATGEPWALHFPVITIRDMVRAQKLVVEHLGIEQLFCVIGGSMGGMQGLQWASRYPEEVFATF